MLGLAPGAGAVVTNGRVVMAGAPAPDEAASPQPLVAGDFALLQVNMSPLKSPHGQLWLCAGPTYALLYTYQP